MVKEWFATDDWERDIDGPEWNGPLGRTDAGNPTAHRYLDGQLGTPRRNGSPKDSQFRIRTLWHYAQAQGQFP